jgi:MFS family permease
MLTPASTPTKFEWKILILAAIITTINFIDRSALSFAIQPIETAFGLNNTEFGIIAAAFGLGYIVMTIAGGILVDKYGTVGTWAISAFVWSIATLLTGFAEGFWSFFCLRVFLGLAEGIHFPALLRTIVSWLPMQWRARAMSACIAGIPIASIIGGPITAHLIDALGWQAMFFVLGSVGTLWVAAWLLLFRHRPKVFFKPHTFAESPLKGFQEVIPGGILRAPWRQIFTSSAVQTTCILYFIFGYILAFPLMWLPGYLAQTHGTSITTTGYLVLPPWIGSAVCLFIGGWSSDLILKKTGSLRKARSFLMSGALFVSGLCFFAVAFSDSFIAHLIWLTAGFSIAFIFNSAVYALIGDLFGAHAGAVQGLVSTFFALSLAVSPSVTGWLAQTTGNFNAVFCVMAILAIGGAFIGFIFQHPDKEKPF